MSGDATRFEPGTVVKLKSGGDLAMTVTSCDGLEVEVAYATNTKIMREKLLAAQLVQVEQDHIDEAETARTILFILARAGAELPAEEKAKLDYHLAEFFKLLGKRPAVENLKS